MTWQTARNGKKSLLAKKISFIESATGLFLFLGAEGRNINYSQSMTSHIFNFYARVIGN
jgi:hypothetical protein